MKTVAWVAVAYLTLVGAATFYSNMATSSPTADSVAALPSTGSLLGSTGTTAAVLDLATAGAVYWFLVK